MTGVSGASRVTKCPSVGLPCREQPRRTFCAGRMPTGSKGELVAPRVKREGSSWRGWEEGTTVEVALSEAEILNP